MQQVTKHFKKTELHCPCCEVMEVSYGFLQFLENVRKRIGKPMIITSGYRCEKHNSDPKVKGSKGSAHLLGKAVDVLVESDQYRYALIDAAIEFGATGIGVYDKHVHIDVKPRHDAVIWLG